MLSNLTNPHGSLFHVLVSICNVGSVTAIVDTGSAVSILSSKFVRATSEGFQPASLFSVSGQPLSVLGVADITFSIHDRTFMFPLYLVDNVIHDMILGLDFLQRFVASIDIASRSLLFDSFDVSLSRESSFGSSSHPVLANLVALGPVSLPPYSCLETTWSGDMANDVSLHTLAPSVVSDGQVCCEVLPEARSCGTGFVCTLVNKTPNTFDLSKSERIAVTVMSTEPNVPDDNMMNHLPNDWLSGHAHLPSSILALLKTYATEIDSGVRTIALPEVSINTGQSLPVWRNPYRLGPEKREFVRQQCDTWLKRGVISLSTSPWAAPVVVVPKSQPDGTRGFRLCGDFTRLNPVLQQQHFPLPRPDDLIDDMVGAQIFSKIDLQQAYLQLPVAPDDRHKLSIITPDAQYQFNYLPFGVSIAASHMQRVMHLLFAEYKGRGIATFQDDVCVYSKDLETHLALLRIVMETLSSAGLLISIDKCSFLQTSIAYLGTQISAMGVSPDPKNVEAVKNWLVPSSIKEVRYVLGAASYYRKFIPNFSARTSCLRSLTHKHAKFTWSDQHQKEFEDVKDALTSPPVLTIYDPTLPIMLKTDASADSVGAVLVQVHAEGERVVAYASSALTKQQVRWSTSEKECWAVVWAIRTFRHYLDGQAFKVVTDHHSLCWLMSIKDPTSKLARWTIELQSFNMTVQFKSGSCHVDADCLSRMPTLSQTVSFVDAIDFQAAQDLEKEKGELPSNVIWHPRLGVYVYSKNRKHGVCELLTYVPQALRKQLLVAAHNDSLSGHFGVRKVWHTLKDKYFWPSMFNSIKEFVQSCEECQFRNVPRQKTSGCLQPIVAPRIFHTVAMDFVGPISRTQKGNLYILIAIDVYSRFVIAAPTRNMEAETVAEFLLHKVALPFEFPHRLLTDRAANFMSKLLGDVLDLVNTNKVTTTSYYPQGDGVTERVNQTLIDSLAKLARDEPNRWDQFIPYVTHAYNTSLHSAIGVPPFQAVFGVKPRHPPTDFPLVPSSAPLTSPVEHAVRGFETSRQIVESSNRLAKANDAAHYNPKHRDQTYETGTLVLIKDLRIPQKGKKLRDKYLGPYTIIEKINPVTYKVTNGERTIPVHVSKLKVYFPRPEFDSPLGDPEPRYNLRQRKPQVPYDARQD